MAQKTPVVIKRQTVGDEVHILCRSDARVEKDRAHQAGPAFASMARDDLTFVAR
jgi:hypothetical protein